MAGDYAVLAPIYDKIGLAELAKTMTPRLLNYAQGNGWLGRSIVDLGCGTGESIHWLGKHGYNATGIDSQAEMLDITRRKIEKDGLRPGLYQQDIRDLDTNQIGTVDMVLSLGVINELDSLRDLETVFNNAHHLLGPQKWFIFDMQTIQGLTEYGTRDSQLIHDSPDLTVFATNHYDYERQIATTRYIVFTHSEAGWQRQIAKLVLRAYPVQATATLLQRCGFNVIAVLDSNLNPFEPGAHVLRVFFIAQKP